MAKVNTACIISPYSQSYWAAALKVSLLKNRWDVGGLDVHAQSVWNVRFSPQPPTAVEGSCCDIAFIRMKLSKLHMTTVDTGADAFASPSQLSKKEWVSEVAWGEFGDFHGF